MERFLGQEGWLFRFLDRLWDLIVLNVLFIITCIPLFTVGAAISALYTVTMKGVRKEDSYIVRSYLSAFKENFKKSTILWLLMIAVWGVLLTDIFVIGKNNSALIAMGGCFGVFWLLITLFAFQLQARFENSIQNTLLNCFILAVKRWLSTIQLAGITAMVPLLVIFLAVLSPTALGWFCSLFIFIGFSGIAWVKSFIYRNVFDSIEDV